MLDWWLGLEVVHRDLIIIVSGMILTTCLCAYMDTRQKRIQRRIGKQRRYGAVPVNRHHTN